MKSASEIFDEAMNSGPRMVAPSVRRRRAQGILPPVEPGGEVLDGPMQERVTVPSWATDGASSAPYLRPDAPVRNVGAERSSAAKGAALASLLALVTGNRDAVPVVAGGFLSGRAKGDDSRWKTTMERYDAEGKRLREKFLVDRAQMTDNRLAAVAEQNRTYREDRLASAQKAAEDKLATQKERDEAKAEVERIRAELRGREADLSGEREKRLAREALLKPQYKKLEGFRAEMRNAATTPERMKFLQQEVARIERDAFGIGETTAEGVPITGPLATKGLTPDQKEDNARAERESKERVRQWAARFKLDQSKFTAAEAERVWKAEREGKLDQLQLDKFEYQKKQDTRRAGESLRDFEERKRHNKAQEANAAKPKAGKESTPEDVTKKLQAVQNQVVTLDAKINTARSQQRANWRGWSQENKDASHRALLSMGEARAGLAKEKVRLQRLANPPKAAVPFLKVKETGRAVLRKSGPPKAGGGATKNLDGSTVFTRADGSKIIMTKKK